MKRTRQLLFLVIYWTLYSNLLYKYTLLYEFKEYLSLVPDAIVIYLLFNHRKRLKPWKNKRILGTLLYYIYPIIFAMGVFNAFLNKVPPLTVLWGLRMTCCFGLFFVLALNFCNKSDVKRAKEALYQGYNVCLFFCVIDFLNGRIGDNMGGIFGGNGSLALLSVLISIIAANDFYNKQLVKRKLVIIIAGMYIIAIWAEIKFLYFIIPICFLLPFVLTKKISVGSVLVVIVVALSIIPFSQKVMSYYYDEEYIENTFDEEKMQEYNTNEYGFQKGGFNRGTVFELTTPVILKDIPHILFGYGTGSGSVSETFPGILYDKYKNTTYHYFFISYVLSELGWIGFSMFTLCLLLLALRFYKYYRKYTRNATIKYWSVCGITTSVLTVSLAYYNQQPYIDYYLFYFVWGICFLAIKFELQEIRNNNSNIISPVVS